MIWSSSQKFHCIQIQEAVTFPMFLSLSFLLVLPLFCSREEWALLLMINLLPRLHHNETERVIQFWSTRQQWSKTMSTTSLATLFWKGRSDGISLTRLTHKSMWFLSWSLLNHKPAAMFWGYNIETTKRPVWWVTDAFCQLPSQQRAISGLGAPDLSCFTLLQTLSTSELEFYETLSQNHLAKPLWHSWSIETNNF